MPQISAAWTPPGVGLLREFPSVQLQLSLREAGLLISALKADAEAALDAGDADLHRQLRDRAADLREAAAANAKRLLRDLSARRTQKRRARA